MSTVPREPRARRAKENKGRLKIFFGCGDKAERTRAMLEAGQKAADEGVDVVLALPIGEAVPPKTEPVLPNGEGELDITAALARSPELLIVDDLAHFNRAGSRHAKRFQDIDELLCAGINVYTTLGVQNIESLNDVVLRLVGLSARERVPDSVFDQADSVEFVDIDLNERHSPSYSGEGGVDLSQLSPEKLTALRELALRRIADRMVYQNECSGELHTAGEHILVCLSSAPSNAKIIRTAARMAYAARGKFTALFVETPEYTRMGSEDKARLKANISLATQLGAGVETVYGDDVPQTIAEFARLSGISTIVIGRSVIGSRHFFRKPTLTEQLISAAPNLDVHIIPDAATASTHYRGAIARSERSAAVTAADILKSVGILLAVSLLGMIFERLGFTEVNIITIYILGVMITSVLTNSRAYSLISSAVSVIVFNFLFTTPRYTLLAYDSGYPLTFLVMFTSAFITGSLAAKLKINARQSAQAAYRTAVLLDTNQLLQQSRGQSEIVEVTANQLNKLLNCAVIVYLAEGGSLGEPKLFGLSGEAEQSVYFSEPERAAADWVLLNNKQAGAGTDTFSECRCLYLSLRGGEHIYGVIGIVAGENAPDSFERSIILSIIGDCALAMENEKNRREKEEAAVLAKNEQLRADLLRAISHDLRTPLTSISGNASNLLSNAGYFDEATKIRLYTDIYDDSMWLINLVENLLSVTRLEEGRMNLNISAELVDDVINEALRHVDRQSVRHHISVESENELLLAQMDAKLIVQVLINIIDNAIKYTQEGSDIVIRSRREGNMAVVSVADDGEGIAEEIKPKVFDMFFTGANRIADSRRSLGLGLALCKSIITAHGGMITLTDNTPHGTIFTFTLPVKEAHLHE